MTYGFPGVESPYDDVFEYGEDGGLWGLDDAEDVQLAKVASFISRFPKPIGGRGVRADAVLAALREMMPLARKVASLSDGSQKRGLVSRMFGPGGQGTLTGSTVTASDKTTANRIIYEVETRLPSLGSGAIDSTLYSQIQTTAHQLLKIGHDMGDDVSAVIDNFSRALDSFGEALVELPGTVLDLVQRGGQAAGDALCTSPAGAFMWHCWPTWKKAVVITAASAGGLLLLYGAFKILKAAAPVARGYVEKQTGIRGIGTIGKTRSGKTMVCFKGRRSRRSRRERVCFPARDKRTQ